MSHEPEGWGSLEDLGDHALSESLKRDKALVKSAARCFSGTDGERLSAYLYAITRDRCLGPDASDAMLRHLEGQRYLVAHIHRLIGEGLQRL